MTLPAGEIAAEDAQARAERLVGAMRVTDGFSARVGVEVVVLFRGTVYRTQREMQAKMPREMQSENVKHE